MDLHQIHMEDVLDEFTDQDQRSRSPGTKMAFFGPFDSLHVADVW